MRERREQGMVRKRPRRFFHLRSGSILVPLLFCVLVGCESNFGTRLQQGDPLLGIHTAPPSPTTPSTPNSAMVQATSGPIPPLPASYTAPGTAPVASGETAVSENPRDLRMTGNPVAPASPYSNSGDRGTSGAARGVAPAVRVGNPEPAPTPGTTANLATAPAAGTMANAATASAGASSSANIRTYEDAQQFLKQHGVTWQRISQDDGEWKFACGIPNPSNPHVNRTYQTSRPFPDLLSAMRAVIAQIEQTSH